MHALALLALLDVVAIKAGHLIDPDAGKTTDNAVVVVENGRIRDIGKAVPAGARVIDLSRWWVMPGLFDVHSHLCALVSERRDASPMHRNLLGASLVDTNAWRGIVGVANAKSVLESGFTTVRDVGNAGNYVDTDLRRAIERGIVPGPTMVNAGRIIAPYGGQFHLQPERRELGEPEYFFADTRDEMLKAIRENIHYGARVIKLVIDDQRYIYSADDVRFMVKEAGRWGLKVCAHCVTDAGCRAAAEGGVASVEHGWRIGDEVMRIIKKNNVVFVPTDGILEFTSVGSEDQRKFYQAALKRLQRAHELGLTATMAYGTDTAFDIDGYSRGEFSIACVKAFIDAHIPAMVVLRAMTGNAARLLGVEKDRGLVRPGLAADLVAMPADPQQDLKALAKIGFVMKDGRVIRAP